MAVYSGLTVTAERLDKLTIKAGSTRRPPLRQGRQVVGFCPRCRWHADRCLTVQLCPQQRLYFLPDPHGHESLRPILPRRVADPVAGGECQNGCRPGLVTVPPIPAASPCARAGRGTIPRPPTSVPQCSLRGRSGARRPRHARASGRAVRGAVLARLHRFARLPATVMKDRHLCPSSSLMPLTNSWMT